MSGSTYTFANGINDSGQIVGEYYDAGGTQHGFLLDNGIYTTLDAKKHMVKNYQLVNG